MRRRSFGVRRISGEPAQAPHHEHPKKPKQGRLAAGSKVVENERLRHGIIRGLTVGAGHRLRPSEKRDGCA